MIVESWVPRWRDVLLLLGATAIAFLALGAKAGQAAPVAPGVMTQPAQDIASDRAVLEATLNAQGAPTTYFFEYGRTTAYGSSVPATPADGGSGSDTVGVVQALDGLSASATYHYRIVASNSGGTVQGADQTFTTSSPFAASSSRQGIPGAGSLPDNRGWELVSPSLKHGADVMVNAGRTRAAGLNTSASPMAATFSSLGGFADAHGSDAATDYMSIRTAQPDTSGWTTHGITPPEKPLTFFALVNGFQSQWEGEFSPDLSKGIFRSYAPQTDAPNVSALENLYRRDDLRDPGFGSYQLLTDCPACGSPLPGVPLGNFIPRFAGASADFRHVIYESAEPLVTGSTAGPGNPNLFEWVSGTLRLAGILPDSACGSPPCVAPASVAGAGAGGAFNSGFTVPSHAISANGSRIIFTDVSTGDGANTGALYMRIDGTTTVPLNASEKSSPDPSQPARYQDASRDGSRVFFTSGEQLTDAPTNGSGDLYMYDLNAPAGHRLTLISADHEPADASNGVDGVMGASADGHTVYFIASGQLVAGAPVLQNGHGIYEWTDRAGTGRLFYIGQLSSFSIDNAVDLLPSLWDSGPNDVRVTPDGGHLLFVSSSGDGLTGYPSNGHPELYLYSAESHQLQCASCRPDGTPADGDATDMSLARDVGASGSGAATAHQSHPVTEDGSRVFFTSTDRLVPGDVNDRSDAYEFDTATGTLHLLSRGTDDSDSYFMDASADGNDVFFVTRQALVGWDTDENFDLYDARVNGGFPDPRVPQACSGEGCRGSVPTSPGIAPSGSQTLHSTGNVKPKATHPKHKPVKCKRGFVRKRVRGRVRCVKKAKRRQAVKRSAHVRGRGR